MGVVNILAANFTASLIDTNAQIFADIIIICGIFNDLVGLVTFFAISIKRISEQKFAYFFAKFKKDKSSILMIVL
ncbi:hypothetical protein GCM10022423_01340 [Flavobacterium ginsengiterrae]|uniref:Cation efflux family protein n=1 Tax=Flavobacterium ginsengiterrae TaxID=871695 RepID=A0ABP7G432_9FLAO